MNFNNAKFVTSFGISSQLPKSDTLEITFAGRSNVGKSSAINKIFNRKSIARVSCVPGKTATINFYSADNTTFVDLPGYGYAKVAKSEKSRWSELIEGYFNQDRNFGLIISLIDMRHKTMEIDLSMINFLLESELPFVLLLTKSDKLNKTEFKQRLEAFKTEIPEGNQITMIPFSSETGQGVEEIRKIIDEVVEQNEYHEALLADLQDQQSEQTQSEQPQPKPPIE
ncbi:MAG: ribosome biogenesis GTP-binding protein YihA/YsxC [Oscillospiraceae bacterium]